MKIPKGAIVGMKDRMTVLNIAQRELQSYLEGCVRGMGLEGEWDINTATWTVEKKTLEKEVIEK